MMDGWEIIDGNSAGSFTGGGNKLVIHTTEGNSIAGAVGAYRKNNSWPHFTISFEEKRKVQHLPVNVAARSLANNTSDGWQTNRADCVQVEIVGKAGEASGWSTAKLDWIAGCFNEIRQAYYFPLNYLDFKLGAKRLSDQEFVAYEGIVGHEHVPDNDHWDPGDLNVEYIVSKMGGSIPSPSQPEGVTVTTSKIYSNVRANKLDSSGNGYTDVYHGQGKDPLFMDAVIENGFNKETKKYPTHKPLTYCSAMENSFVRVTILNGAPNGEYTFDLRCDW